MATTVLSHAGGRSGPLFGEPGDPPAPDPRSTARTLAIARGIGVAVAAIGGLIVVGWELDISSLRSIYPGWTPVRANAACGFGLGGLSLLLLAGGGVRHSSRGKRFGKLLAITIAVLGALTLSEYVLGVDLRIDRLLVGKVAGAAATPIQVRMGPLGAFSLLLLGLALLYVDAGTPRKTPQAPAVVAGLVAFLSVIGYLNGIQPRYRLEGYEHLTPAGTLMVLALSLGLLLARPSDGVVGLMRSRTAGAVLLRRLVAVALLLPPLTEWLRIQAEELGVIDRGVGSALLVIVHVVTFAAVSWWCAQTIAKYDIERKRALAALGQSSAALATSHALLVKTARIAHVGGFDRDVAADKLVWSEETCRMFGRDPTTYLPTMADFISAIHPSDRGRVRHAIDASINDNEPFYAEFRIIRPDGLERAISTQAEVIRDASGKAARVTGTLQDITEHKASERALRIANALLKAQIEGSPDGILVVGFDRRIVSFNERFVALWNIPADPVQSRSDERAVASILDRLKDPGGFVARLAELYARPEERSHDEVELKDGRLFERHSSPFPISGDEGPGRIFFFRDITARKRAEESIARMARQDGLTGLANRGVFLESVQQAIARARRGGESFALLYLDLDHFKDVNDTLGHPAGDLLLQGVAARLQASVREADIVARFGGDEFAIIASHVAEPTGVAALAERLHGALRVPFSIHGDEVRVDTSIGMAVYGSDVTSAEILLSQADLALYRAKGDGRGTSRFYVEGMDAEVRARVALVSELRAGIDAGQLFLVYQPQVEIATGRIVGLEALARWRHPRRGLVGPGEFIPIAERSGLIVPLGRWVMGNACRQIKLWIDAGIAPETVAINVSAAQFRTPRELETTLTTILAETELPPQRLEIEFTESVLMEAWLEQRDALKQLRESGVKLAIDDFGTGFSSLEYLSRFPVDRIKIAQTFVADLGRGAANDAIVRATIGLGRELGLQVIAEGVETHEQLDLLRAWGCGEAQGYYFARPLPVDEIECLLREGTIHPRASRSPQPAPGDADRRWVAPSPGPNL